MRPDRARLEELAAGIRLLVLDVDGVMTDGQLHYDPDGREYKSFNVRDGYGIVRALKEGIEVAVISGRPSRSAAGRMRELGVRHVWLGVPEKGVIFDELLARLDLPASAAACVGDDVPDLPLLTRAGLAIAVGDAHPDILPAVHWQTTAPGGRGAVREVCDLLHAAMPADRRATPPAGG